MSNLFIFNLLGGVWLEVQELFKGGTSYKRLGNSSVMIRLGAGRPGLVRFFIFTTMSRPALWFTQPHIPLVPRFFR
jgi:hypothetical protein